MSERRQRPLKTTEVAERLSCSLQNVYDIIHAGLLPAFRVGADGGGIRVAEEDLQEFIESRKTAKPLESRRGRITLKHVKLQKPA